MKRFLRFLLISSLIIFPLQAQSFERRLMYTSPLMTGEDVKLVEEKLLNLGFCPGDGTDGEFDEKTAQALKDYQLFYGFKNDGIVTRELFDSLKTCESSSLSNLRKKIDSAVKEANSFNPGNLKSGQTLSWNFSFEGDVLYTSTVYNGCSLVKADIQNDESHIFARLFKLSDKSELFLYSIITYTDSFSQVPSSEENYCYYISSGKAFLISRGLPELQETFGLKDQLKILESKIQGL